MRGLRMPTPLGPGTPGDRGVVGPGAVWRIAREKVVLLGAPAALVVQESQQSVARAVDDFSEFQRDPLGRMIGILNALLAVTYGDTTQARAAVRYVNERHAPVVGTLKGEEGERPDGASYSANDSELKMVVMAPLVELALDVVSKFIRELSWGQRCEYYAQYRSILRAFGIREEHIKPDYASFVAYYEELVSGMRVTPMGQKIVHATLNVRLYGIPVGPVAKLLAGYFSHQHLAQAHDLPQGRLARAIVDGMAWVSRQIVPLLPGRIRYWQAYRVARERMLSG